MAPYCLEHGIRLPSIKRLLMAGAPVPPELIRTMLTEILSEDADVLTPFGATEAMPLTTISGREIIAETAALTETGKGMAVGVALPGVSIRVIGISDEPISEWHPDLVCLWAPLARSWSKAPWSPGPTSTVPTRRPWPRSGGQRDLARWEIWAISMHGDGSGSADARRTACRPRRHALSGMVETIFNRHGAVARTALVGSGQGMTNCPCWSSSHCRQSPADILAQQRSRWSYCHSEQNMGIRRPSSACSSTRVRSLRTYATMRRSSARS